MAAAKKIPQQQRPDREWFVRIAGWQPHLPNQWDGRHWSVRSRMKKHDRQVIGLECLGAGVAKQASTGKRRVSLLVTIGPGQHRPPDPDAWWKSTLDALVSCGVLRDDGRSAVELGEPVEYEDGPVKGITIRIQELEPRTVYTPEQKVKRAAGSRRRRQGGRPPKPKLWSPAPDGPA